MALLSGGIDSPVAIHLMLSRGVDVVSLHMDNRPAKDAPGDARASRLVRKLADIHGRELEAYTAPHGVIHQAAAVKGSPPRFRCVLCKRAMLRTAEGLAQRVGASAIITGESLGQVASQTLPNMAAEDAAVSIPVLRPLVGMDKVEIIDIARETGTFEISIGSADACAFVPPRPATESRVEVLVEAEEAFRAGDVVGLLVEGLTRLDY